MLSLNCILASWPTHPRYRMFSPKSTSSDRIFQLDLTISVNFDVRSWWRDPMQSAKRQCNIWWILANTMNWKLIPPLKIMKYGINSNIYSVRRTQHIIYLNTVSGRCHENSFKPWITKHCGLIVSRIRFSWSSHFTTLAFSGILKR